VNTLGIEDRGQSRLDALLDNVERSLADDLMPVDVFNDPEVFRAEMERIFLKSWMFVAHESELPNEGDFVLRRIGVDAVIVTRDQNGSLNVLSNYCRHRGTEICRTDRGNALHFKCPYHGWMYKCNGDWAGAPHLVEAYGGRLDPKAWGLLRAPHVDSYRGLVFAALSADAPTLRDYLGATTWMLDALLGLHPDGMRVVGPPDRFRIRTDWKVPSDNFAGDDYHLETTHRSTEMVKVTPRFSESCQLGRSYELGGGHSFVGHDAARTGGTLWGYPKDVVETFQLSALDAAQRQMVTHAPPTVGTIFPNLSFLRSIGIAQFGRPPAVYTSFRQWQPISAGVCEYWNWHLAWNFETEEQAWHAYQVGQYNVGAGGLIEQDDTAVWEGSARAGASPWLRQAGVQFNFQQGRRTKVDVSPDPTWTGPGIRRNTGYGDFRQVAFYRRWLELMRPAKGVARPDTSTPGHARGLR
jgi:N,N-dimethyl phenylurea N-demethylase alpha subunit